MKKNNTMLLNSKEVNDRTSLREIMVARAMASSMIIDDVVTENIDTQSDSDQETNYNLNAILIDWFKHEN